MFFCSRTATPNSAVGRRRRTAVYGAPIAPQPSMLVTNHRAFADCEAFADRWDGLAAGCAFRTWQWLSVWWEHYGAQRRSRPTASAFGTRRLAILAAHDDQSPNGVNQSEPVAILPAYVDISLARGRVLRLLGDGEVCSDHLGMLAAPDAAAAAAAAIARHLASSNQWDAVEFSSVDSDDRTTQFLFHELAQHGFSVGRETGPRCWSIELPDSWDEFLQMQSKSHRKQLRRAARRLEDDGRCRWRIVKRPSELDDAWENLIELHQRRRRSLGEPGCFTSPSWASFHRSISSRMLAAGRLRLSSLEINGVAAAAEYHFVGGRTTFAY
ncbi:MAG: GNAT family N-acetyltransferase, partial [Planctomycetota bacterium]